MAIKANIKITTRDKKGNLVEYKKGSVIKDFTEDEEKRLIKNRSAEAVETVKATSDNNMQQNETEQQTASGPNTGYPA